MLAHTLKGTGQPVVFLHGFCESKEIWTEFTAPLASDFQTIALDMPGFGDSASHSGFRSVEALAGAVADFLDTLGLEKPILVAHSLGGYVALALAEMQPERLSGLCLFHSTAYADSDEKKQSRDKTAAFIGTHGLDAFLENFVPGLFYKPRHAELAGDMARLRQLAGRTPAEMAVAVTLAMRDRPDRTHVLQQAAFPVLFIAGKNDEAVAFESARTQFFLPKHALVQALADTSHMGMYERPAETQAMIGAFLRLCLPPLQGA